jgi:NADP-dependent 3-hydroxy acid dehydrogenase YdfG
MNDLFKGKVVIFTGAYSGNGEAIAREFERNGSKVVLAARSESRLASIVESIKKDNGEAFFLKTDVSIEDDCRNLVEKTVSKYGTVNILVNNAGLSMRAAFPDVDLKVLHRLMDVNLWVTVYCTKMLYHTWLPTGDPW